MRDHEVVLIASSDIEQKALLAELQEQDVEFKRQKQDGIIHHRFEFECKSGVTLSCRMYLSFASDDIGTILRLESYDIRRPPGWTILVSSRPSGAPQTNEIWVPREIVDASKRPLLSFSAFPALVSTLNSEGLLEEALGNRKLKIDSWPVAALGVNSTETDFLRAAYDGGSNIGLVTALGHSPEALVPVAARVVLESLYELDVEEASVGFPRRSSSTVLSEKVQQIDRLSIRNLRVFESFRLELASHLGHSGQWVLLLGDNGVGKTTILRSVALALADRHSANSLLQLSDPGAPFLRDSDQEGFVKIVLNGQEREVGITANGRGEQLSASTPAFDLPIYAYGCPRGTALGGPKRDVELRPLDDIRSLFDVNANLIHAETWLRDLYTAALEDPKSNDKEFFDSVCETAEAILSGVEKLEVDKNGVWLTGEKVGERVPLAALSDGYVTTAGWIFDLIARWSQRCRDLGIELKGDFREQMNALVLIDEIDLHLHPLWQTEVVRLLREQFPQLSVIATTHNPLTLLGAQPGEIHVLRPDPDSGKIVAHQVDIPPGTRADEVLTGEWFGLPSTVDRETRAMLAEHREMLRADTPPDDTERRALEGKLRKRLGVYANTAEDRIAESIVAQLLPNDYEELSPEERKDIYDNILDLARQRAEELDD